MLMVGWLGLCSASPLVRDPGRWSHFKFCQPLQQRKRDWDRTHTRPCETSAQNDFHHTCSHFTGQSKSHGHAERPGTGEVHSYRVLMEDKKKEKGKKEYMWTPSRHHPSIPQLPSCPSHGCPSQQLKPFSMILSHLYPTGPHNLQSHFGRLDR